MARRAPSEAPAQRGPSTRPAPAPAPVYTPAMTASTTDTSRASTAPRSRRRRPRNRSIASTASTATDASTDSFGSTGSTSATAAPAPKRRSNATTTATAADPFTEGVIGSLAAFGTFFLSLTAFVRDTLTTMLRLLRTPMSILLCLYLLAVVVGWGCRVVSIPISNALLVLCDMPGVSLLDIPGCDAVYAASQSSTRTDFKALVDVQAEFDEIIEKAASGSNLAYDLKKSEFAVSDLNTLVRASTLGCRDELSARLEGFILDAKKTSKDLSRFGSTVNGVVDSIISVDTYALRTLSAARALELSATSNSIVASYALAPFRRSSPLAAAEKTVMATFIAAGNVMDTSIQDLIMRAKGILSDLEEIDNKLKVIHEVVTREGNIIGDAYHDVLGTLWTFLGGNRAQIGRYKSHLQLLQDLSGYRGRAVAHLRMSLLKLEKMQTDLEDLRGHVARPGVLAAAGAVDALPLEVQMEIIRRGVDRLSESMGRARRTVDGQRESILAGHVGGTIELE